MIFGSKQQSKNYKNVFFQFASKNSSLNLDPKYYESLANFPERESLKSSANFYQVGFE